MTVHESDTRLGELILYISQKSVGDSYYGSTKLNKLLYYSDFLFYAQHGRTITGAEYWNQPDGPVPVRLVQVRESLQNEQPEPALAIQHIRVGNYTQKRPVHLRLPDLSLFRGHELAFVDDVTEKHRNFNGSDISNKSHHEWGWKLTQQFELIHPSSIILAPDTDTLTDSEIEELLSGVPG
jgi:hypothetical protein